MLIEKPADVFNRGFEWDALAKFVTRETPGVRIGIVRGRRRNGKSFVLRHLCQAVDGAYTLALREGRTKALARFSEDLSRAVGVRLGRFDDWAVALDAAVDTLTRVRRGGIPLLVIDEFPYMVAHSEELPSAIQALYDRRGPSSSENPPFKLILCGSAISVMSTLAAGNQALRGRAILDLRMQPFHYRDSAVYWEADPSTALLVDAVLGGAPGYREIVDARPTSDPDGFAEWLAGSVLNRAHILFAEPDYLLAEDPRISDRTIYFEIWDAVSSGATTPTQIGAAIGVDAKSLTYHLNIMRDGGFIRYDQDMLLQRRPVITVADPAIRFHNLVVRPNIGDLEMGNIQAVWARSQEAFSARILGPHFELLAREWTRWYGREAGLDDVGPIGTTQVACRQHRGHQVDVIALDRYAIPRGNRLRVTMLGEAKCTNRPRTLADLERLEHIRDVLVAQGRDAAGAALAVFSRSGFDQELTAAGTRGRVLLLDLPAMYGTTPARA